MISSNKTICTLQITDTTGSHQFPAMQRLSISKVPLLLRDSVEIQFVLFEITKEYGNVSNYCVFQGHAFILVYSVSSRQSLEELKPIWQTIKEIKGADLPNIPVMLAGNKCDESPEIREVSAAEGQAQASAWGVSFMETSAKTNHNVTQLFQVGFISFFYSKGYDILIVCPINTKFHCAI